MTLSVHVQTPEERAASLLALERETTHELRRVFLLSVGVCFVWMAIGLGLMAWAFHTTDQRYASVAFWSALFVTDVGVLATLLITYRRGESAGWI